MAKPEAKQDRFEEVLAELGNCVSVAFGIGSTLAHEHDPESLETFSSELKRYRRLVAELREIHSAKRPE